MRVAVLTDAAGVAPVDRAKPDVAIGDTVAAVEAALRASGRAVTRVAADDGGRWIDVLRGATPDVVFNLCEGVRGDAAFEAPVIAALELLGVAHTGSSAWTAALCLRKPATNAVLAAAGLPVPPWALLGVGGRAPDVGWPAIVKPAAEDASLGVEQGAVVADAAALAAQLERGGRRWGGGLLVQRFVDGREVNVGVLGGAALPIAEIDFSAMPADHWRIVSYRSKWDAGSDEDRGARPVCPAPLAPALAAELEALALAAWDAVGGGGYGRVDFRVDRAGRPWVLEVNPNPDLAPDAGLARMAGAAGLDYAALVRRIVELARGTAGRHVAGAVGPTSPGGRQRMNVAAAAGAS